MRRFVARQVSCTYQPKFSCCRSSLVWYATSPLFPVPSRREAIELPLSLPSAIGVGPAVMPLLKLKLGEEMVAG